MGFVTRQLIAAALVLVGCVGAEPRSGAGGHGPPDDGEAAAAREDGLPVEAATPPIIVETVRVELPSGTTEVDLYRPAGDGPAPLVLVAHGFSRSRGNMSGWGRHLAGQGLLAAVPDLPAWADHRRNGRFLGELRQYLCSSPPWRERADPLRVALLGFSAGGLASLLAAAEDPPWALWVGLDPVDRDGLGAAAAPRVTARAVVLTAEPSSCNGEGNARGLVAALPRVQHVPVAGAVHGDGEWPTDALADLFCGRSTAAGQEAFRRLATAALREALARSP